MSFGVANKISLPIKYELFIGSILTPFFTHNAKLSKRNGEVSIAWYREQGFLPEAICNYLALLGWSPGDDKENITMQELVDLFTVERVNSSPARFDMNKSGAGLTWDYFFPDIEMPLFIKMVQDRDLWKWSIPNSKDFTAGLFTLWDGCDYYDFDKIFTMLDNIFTDQYMFNFCMGLGEVINQANSQRAKAIAEAASKRVDKFMGKNVCIVNCSVEHVSEVGNILSSMDNIDFAVMWTYKNPNESYYVSLRSSDKVDVSKIAKAYGGGGHPNASGLNTKIFPPVLFNNPISL